MIFGIRFRRIALFLVLGAVSVGAVYWTFTHWVQFSAFAAATLKAAIGIALYFFTDWTMDELDAVEECRNGNLAVAVQRLGVAIIIAVAVMSA